MSSEDANDVAKALAAFGAPSIRYHSFGQGRPKVGPVPAVPPDVVKPAVVPAAPAPFSPPLLRQAEPEAAPEPFLPSPAAAPRQDRAAARPCLSPDDRPEKHGDAIAGAERAAGAAGVHAGAARAGRTARVVARR